MNEFHRDVLRVGGVRTATEGEQTPSTQEAFRHLAANFRQTRRLVREELFEQFIPLEQPLFHLTCEFNRCCHGISYLTTSASKFAAKDRRPAYPRFGCHRSGLSPEPCPRVVRELHRSPELRCRPVPGSVH